MAIGLHNTIKVNKFQFSENHLQWVKIMGISVCKMHVALLIVHNLLDQMSALNT